MSTPPEVTYVVLDPDLRQAEPPRFAALFAGFAADYARMFTGDEAESTGEWLKRIAGQAPPQPVMRIVVAVERADRREKVIGGAAAEYYRAGRCVLVTYLYVTDSGSHRHRGHARALVAQARMACEALGPVHALLAEVEWPDLLPSRAFSADEVGMARARLRFFARMGARMLNIDYVQPALGPGKQPVSYLRLLLLPSATPGSAHDTDDGRRVAVDGFLAEFYAALAQWSGYPADDAMLRQLRQQTAEARPLTTPLP